MTSRLLLPQPPRQKNPPHNGSDAHCWERRKERKGNPKEDKLLSPERVVEDLLMGDRACVRLLGVTEIEICQDER